jgi:hypothetical protein
MGDDDHDVEFKDEIDEAMKVAPDEDDEDAELDDLEFSRANETGLTSTKVIKYRVPDEDRITSNVMAQSEFTELMSMRCLTLEKNPDSIRVDYVGIRSTAILAAAELQQGKLPLLLRRHIGDNHIEYWDPNQMYVSPAFYDCISKML